MKRVFKNTASDSPEFANATLLTLLPVSPHGNLQSLKPAIARMICCGASNAAKHSVISSIVLGNVTRGMFSALGGR